MRRRLYLGLSGLVFYLSSACVPIPVAKEDVQDFDRTRCNAAAGYELGYNDGRGGEPMNSSYANYCREDLKIASRDAYRKGYSEGRGIWDSQPKPIQIQEEIRVVDDMGFEKDSIRVRKASPYPRDSKRPQRRAFFCKVDAFTKTFEAFGPTRLEARRKAMRKCANRFHEMHCDDDIHCEKNE